MQHILRTLGAFFLLAKYLITAACLKKPDIISDSGVSWTDNVMSNQMYNWTLEWNLYGSTKRKKEKKTSRCCSVNLGQQLISRHEQTGQRLFPQTLKLLQILITDMKHASAFQSLPLSITEFYNHTEAGVVTVPPTLGNSSTSPFCIVSNR